jgi:hypothetical protein
MIRKSMLSGYDPMGGHLCHVFVVREEYPNR